MPNERTISVPWTQFIARVHFSSELFLFFETARKLAEARGLFLYIAGGPVRDFLLGQKIKDLDLVLEGDWEQILETLLAVTGARLLMKSQFLTYKVQVGKITVDLATSRKEAYPEPAVLPQVFPAGLEEDIRRRDFTINALVYGLTHPYREKILDLVGGVDDLEKGLIRPLHEKSFIDDPTRILRGIRYKIRLSFNYTEDFFRALEIAKQIGSPRRLSSSRLAQELLNLVKKEPLHLLYRTVCELRAHEIFEAYGLVEREFQERDINTLSRAKMELTERDFQKLFLLSLVKLCVENFERLGFSRDEIELFEKQIGRVEKVMAEDKDILEKVEVLEKIPAFLLYRLLMEDQYYEIVEKYLSSWRFIRPSIGGKELKSLGISEGKRIGEILREIRRKKLLGELRSQEEELDFARSLIFSKD